MIAKIFGRCQLLKDFARSGQGAKQATHTLGKFFHRHLVAKGYARELTFPILKETLRKFADEIFVLTLVSAHSMMGIICMPLRL
jgi:hypothetical protein